MNVQLHLEDREGGTAPAYMQLVIGQGKITTATDHPHEDERLSNSANTWEKKQPGPLKPRRLRGIWEPQTPSTALLRVVTKHRCYGEHISQLSVIVCTHAPLRVI